jgi:uncharacterized repeat protein (TIGR01451 family)
MRWLIGLVVLLLLALVLESGLLAYAAYVLLGVLLVSRLLARNALRNLESSRECPRQTAEIGDTVPVTLTVRNRGWLPVPWVLLEDLLPDKLVAGKYPRLRVKGKRLLLRMMRGGGKLTVRYDIQTQMRGYYQIGPLVMESGDLFGLHRRYHVGAAPHFLLVYPKVVPLEGYDIVSRRPIGEVRLTHRLYEDPTRIAGVRRYETGDPLNRVHWRATARTGALHCKVYEPSTLAGVTVLLDFHRAGYEPRGEPHRSELAVTAAASLANAVYVLGQQVGLVTNGRDAADRIRVEGWEQDYRTRQATRQTAMREQSDRLEPVIVETRRGVEQLERIREALARVELTDGLTLAQLVAEAAHRLPRDATVLAVLPDAPPETALALGNLRRRGHAVAAVLVMVDEQRLEQAVGRLLAEGVRDVRRLRNEEELPALCRQEAGGAATYQVVTEY